MKQVTQKINADAEVEEPDESSEDGSKSRPKVEKTDGELDKFNSVLNKYLEEYKHSIHSR